MDTGAQQDVPNTDANASSARTAENADAGDKSAGIDKRKSPEFPKVRIDPTSAGENSAKDSGSGEDHCCPGQDRHF
jgi:hypothetical protein